MTPIASPQEVQRRQAVIVSVIALTALALSSVLYARGVLPISRLLFSRLLLCGVAGSLLGLAGLLREQVARAVRTFFTEAGDPLNLAVFRIVLFGLIFSMTDTDEVRWFSQMPEALRIFPWGTRWWLLQTVPINETWATAACIGLRIACVTAVVGLFSRTSALIVAVLAIYVLGIPQFFGKVNHYHHVVWFAAILAASRCGDALSLDAIVAAWRRAGRGNTAPPEASRAYALPIRFVWLLMGMLYFFPGFWKWWAAGIDWVWSDNLKSWMYSLWFEHPGWTPPWRIDQYPLAYQLAALGVIIFEMGFFWCMFSRRLRRLAAVGGIAFHQGTGFFMRIKFLYLQVCYVAFVNWAALCRWIGNRLFRQPMAILYDGHCTLCRRTIAILRVFDWLGRVTYVNALDQAELRRRGFAWLDPSALLVDMHAVVGQRRWLGFAAYRALAWRVPLLWPLLPLLYLPPVAVIGRRIYRHVADGRSCRIPSQPFTNQPEAVGRGWRGGTRAVTAVGIFLLLGNLYYGVRGLSTAWPLACYPTFRILMVPRSSTITVAVVDVAGRERILDDSAFRRRASVVRWRNLLGSILLTSDQTQRRARLQALWELWVRHEPALQDVAIVRFYKIVRSTLPEQAGDSPLSTELLWEAKL